jgi:hypothetical protein
VPVVVDGETVAEETVDAGGAGFDVVYPLSSPATRRLIAFRAAEGYATPGITTVRLLRWA